MPERPDQLAGFGLPTYRAYQAILAIRRRYAWLPDARTEVESITNPRIVYRYDPPTPTTGCA